jgi:hypothetical protein
MPDIGDDDRQHRQIHVARPCLQREAETVHDFIQDAELRFVDDLPCDRHRDRRQHHRDHQHRLQKGHPADIFVEQQRQAETEKELGRHRQDGEHGGVQQRDMELLVGEKPHEVAWADEIPWHIGIRADFVNRCVEHVDAGENRQPQQDKDRRRKHEDAQMPLCPAFKTAARSKRRGQWAAFGLQHSSLPQSPVPALELSGFKPFGARLPAP